MKEKDEIEKIFEERLSKKHFVFRESDWEKMEQKLDSNPAISGYFANSYIKWISVITALSVFFLLGWFSKDYFGQDEITDRENYVAEASGVEAEQKRNGDIENNKNNASIQNSDTGNGQITEEEFEKAAGTGSDSEAATATIKKEQQNKFNEFNEQDVQLNKNTEANKSDSFQNNKSQNLSDNTGRKKEDEGINNPDVALNENDRDFKEGIEQDGSEPGEDQASGEFSSTRTGDYYYTSERTVIDIGPRLKGKQAYLSEPELKMPEWIALLVPLTTEGEEELDKKQKFSIGISYAPDFTSSGFMNRYSTAQAFGLQAYYNFNDRWALQTGINYVRKKYDAEPEDYKPYDGYWDDYTYGYVPDEVSGHCSVIDIPLNISRSWSTGGRISLLTSAGISNYILLDEGYSFRFTGKYSKTYTWESYENSKFIAGIINTSIGISWKINNKMRLQVEPYFKIPIQDIGFGNLRLFSTGTAFTLRHKL